MALLLLVDVRRCSCGSLSSGKDGSVGGVVTGSADGAAGYENVHLIKLLAKGLSLNLE